MQVKFSCANISSEVKKHQGVSASARSSGLNQEGIDCELVQEGVNLFLLKWDVVFPIMLSKQI